MRILSQDGMIDVPYEQTNILSETQSAEGHNTAYIIYTQTLGNCYAVATYSTEAKAKKAMEMLREAYLKHLYSQGGAMATADFYVPPFAFIPPKVFQFPADEELEV